MSKVKLSAICEDLWAKISVAHLELITDEEEIKGKDTQELKELLEEKGEFIVDETDIEDYTLEDINVTKVQ